MKSILVPTDFSPSAKNAARYAVHLATMLQENVMLCHALTIPAATFAGQLPGPLEDDQEIKQQAEEELLEV
ncbi:MAG TPA: universal stress protein [Candidatus Babeliaceae bacterium]|jgi:nucleotide-binding universal stress UspA family protein|nr:universal stress protein [Candidatus Babeliaceae bacterium]